MFLGDIMWIEIKKAGQLHIVNTDSIVRLEDTTSLAGMASPGGRTLRIYMTDGKEIAIEGLVEIKKFLEYFKQITSPPTEKKDG